MLATEVIKKKRSRGSLTMEEIQFFIEGYTKGSLPDYQMASLLMAIFLNGMEKDETVNLTQVMLDSGDRVHFDSFPVDKHSTGGVGDKTSLILAPIVAACGVPVPMMSGRGLGHTGGTLDKLESIPGFNVFLDLDTFKRQVEATGLSFIGQTENICPADKKIYALRDVTATVESLPLICASIMSKKIAEGIKGLVLDVKFGSGAFMKTLSDAKTLAESLISIGKGHDIETKALLTNMNQPLGKFVGNSLEIGECLAIMKREDFMGNNYNSFSDTEKLSVELSAHMIAIGKKVSIKEAKQEAIKALDSGQAFEKFSEVCGIQNGNLNSLPLPDKTTAVIADNNGYLQSINSEAVGLAGIELKAGRRVVTDKIDPVTGIEVHKNIGEAIQSGEPIFTIHHQDNSSGLDKAQELLSKCFQIADQTSQPEPLIQEIIL